MEGTLTKRVIIYQDQELSTNAAAVHRIQFGTFTGVDRASNIYRAMCGTQPIVALKGKQKTQRLEGVIHPNILRYIGEITCQGDTYQLFDSYSCVLDYALKHPTITCITDSRFSVNLELKQSQPCSHLANIIRDIMKGVQLLHKKKIFHGNLNASNVALSVTETNQLTTQLMGVTGEGSYFQDFIDLIFIIVDCKTNLQHPTPEADDLVLKMLAKKYNPDLEPLENWFKHPFFWDAENCISFLYKAGELVNFAITSENLAAFASYISAVDAFPTTNPLVSWHDKLPEIFRIKLKGQEVRYRYKETYSQLLLFIRNRGIHYGSSGLQIQNLFGTHPEDFLKLFFDAYPGFMLHVYTCLQDEFYIFSNWVRADYLKSFYITVGSSGTLVAQSNVP